MIEQHNGLFEVIIPCNTDSFDDINELLEQISQWIESRNTVYPIEEFGMNHEETYDFILVVPTMELAVEAELRFS